MAYAAISKPGSYTNPKLYTGTGATNSITGVGFQPDLTWIKCRSAAENHRLFDAVRGVTKYIASNNALVEATDATTLTAFGADGFTLSTAHPVNKDTETYASWNWLANGAGSLNEVGSIDSTVSVNTTSGFSACKFTGTGSTATIGHGLGVTPSMIIFKNLDSAVDWRVYHEAIGNTHRLCLNDNSASTDDDSAFNDTSPTSTLFTVGGSSSTNGSGHDMIAYCFSEIKGYSKFSSYTGNGNADGPYIYTGFKPSFIMFKMTSDTANWMLYDDKREGYNVDNDHLKANEDDVEGTSDDLDILANGFKIRTSGSGENQASGIYAYAAFASEPLVANVGSGIPATAK